MNKKYWWYCHKCGNKFQAENPVCPECKTRYFPEIEKYPKSKHLPLVKED